MAACLEAADSRPQHLSCPARQAGAFSFWGCGQRATPTRVPLSISFHPRREQAVARVLAAAPRMSCYSRFVPPPNIALAARVFSLA